MTNEKIIVPKRKASEIDIDINHYILIRLDCKNALIEVRIIKISEEQLKGKFSNNTNVIADYKGENPEDIYYKIITDGHITNMQHAAYIGSELRKAYIALKNNFDYTQDKELKLVKDI